MNIHTVSNFFLSIFQYINLTQIQTYPNLTRFMQMYLTTFFMIVPMANIREIDILHKMSFLGTFSLLYSIIVKIISLLYKK